MADGRGVFVSVGTDWNLDPEPFALCCALYTRTYGFSKVPLKRQLNTTVAASFHPNQPGSLAELNDVSKSLDKHAV